MINKMFCTELCVDSHKKFKYLLSRHHNLNDWEIVLLYILSLKKKIKQKQEKYTFCTGIKLQVTHELHH